MTDLLRSFYDRLNRIEEEVSDQAMLLWVLEGKIAAAAPAVDQRRLYDEALSAMKRLGSKVGEARRALDEIPPSDASCADALDTLTQLLGMGPLPSPLPQIANPPSGVPAGIGRRIECLRANVELIEKELKAQWRLLYVLDGKIAEAAPAAHGGATTATIDEGKRQGDSAGYLYVLVNPSMEGLVKVGMTERDPRGRARELGAATGVPERFILVFYVLVNDRAKAERFVHDELDRRNCRPNPKREFFKVEPTEAIRHLLDAERVFGPSG
jgi:hypothetical protein